jgi:glycosyltransferase involved in cell wall biosynthesis
MKILVGMPAPDSWGGPIASEPPFVEALERLGHEVVTEVYVYGDKDRPTPTLSRISRVLRTAFRFRKLLRSGEFDLLHLNTAFDMRTILRDSASLFVMHPGRTKVLMKLHGSEAEEFADASWLTKSLIRYIARKVDGFGYHTREELEAFLRLGFDPAKFYPVRNAVTIHENLPANFERPQKSADDISEILFVSRFIPAKGLVETVEACEELRKRGIRFRLTCVGDGRSLKEAQDAVGRLALGRVVTFTGYIPEDEVTKRFMAADLFVFPTSHKEGFPNVLFKAVAVGLPIVTTQVRAARDYLSEPANCLFCTKDATDVADKMELLVRDAELRRSMSRNNLEYGQTLLPDAIAREFDEIYSRLVGGGNK